MNSYTLPICDLNVRSGCGVGRDKVMRVKCHCIGISVIKSLRVRYF